MSARFWSAAHIQCRVRARSSSSANFATGLKTSPGRTFEALSRGVTVDGDATARLHAVRQKQEANTTPPASYGSSHWPHKEGCPQWQHY
jgi:hypothetical protein